MWLKEIQPELHVIKNFLKKDKEIYGSGVHESMTGSPPKSSTPGSKVLMTR